MSSYDSKRRPSKSFFKIDHRKRMKMGLGYGKKKEQSNTMNWRSLQASQHLQQLDSIPQFFWDDQPAGTRCLSQSLSNTSTLKPQFEMPTSIRLPTKPPKILNGYLFGLMIGQGSYAKVKEVVQDQTLMRCAVKIFKDCRLRKIPNGIQNVANEYYLLRQLEHPNCIKMIEFFRVEEKYKQYMVLEFCLASLEKLIDNSTNRRLSEAWSNYFFKQLIFGLDYIHSLGIIHKDIKPANLLVSSNRVLKITDFGVAEQIPLFQSNDNTTILQGTPKFHPPEAIDGEGDEFNGFALDVWAAGVTLYYLLSGEYPFGGTTLRQLYENICDRPLLMPETVDLKEGIVDLLAGLLDKKPWRRLRIHEVIHHRWFSQPFTQEELNWDRLMNWNRLINGDVLEQPVPVYSQLNVLYGRPEDKVIDTVEREQALLPSPIIRTEDEFPSISDTSDSVFVGVNGKASRPLSRLQKMTKCFSFLRCLKRSK